MYHLSLPRYPKMPQGDRVKIFAPYRVVTLVIGVLGKFCLLTNVITYQSL